MPTAAPAIRKQRKALVRVADRRDAPRAPRTRTIPEQIADHLAVQIIRGEYGDGEHIPEQKVASLFGVSHGPVREAIRALSKRGLVEFLPRRGAFVIEVTPNTVADIFNIRAVLLALASHSLAMLPQKPEQQLAEQIVHVRALASNRNADPVSFAQALGRTGRIIYDSCGNVHLTRVLREEAESSLWGHLWREHTLDFLTPKRRNVAAADWAAIVEAILDGDGVRAAKITRKALFDSRDAAIEALQKLRKTRVHPSRFIRE